MTATFWLSTGQTVVLLASVNQQIIDAGHARPYDGGTR